MSTLQNRNSIPKEQSFAEYAWNEVDNGQEPTWNDGVEGSGQMQMSRIGDLSREFSSLGIIQNVRLGLNQRSLSHSELLHKTFNTIVHFSIQSFAS